MPSSSSIQPGDRFIKVESPRTVLVVRRLLDMPNLPPHVALTPEGRDSRALTLSISALLDRRHYRRAAGDPAKA